MNDREIFSARDRNVWREWLSRNFESKKEVWLVFASKDAEEVGVSYNDAVEEALCFGWIDSTTGRLDDRHGIRRFTPRRDGSPYSRPNIERLIWLDRNHMIHPKIRPSVVELMQAEYVFPQDILAAIQADPAAWKNYQLFPDAYRRIRVAYIDAARKRPLEFEKRLRNFLGKTRENKLIVGFGGVDKYYMTVPR